MNRRMFLGSVLAVSGAAFATAAAAAPAQAATLLDELKALEVAPEQSAASDLPAQGATDAQYRRRRRVYRRRVYRRPRRFYRPRRQVCQTFYDRWGRLRRRCWWR